MYLEHFHLKTLPFNITPDPEFLYLSPGHKEALAAMIYGVEQRKGFIAVIGEVGVGKTTMLRSYLDRIDRTRLCPIYLFNPMLPFANLLVVICQELGLEVPSDDMFELVRRLHQHLITEYARGRNIVLIIDEAQNMPVESLERLRMLSNLETDKEKLIQIIFCAQPEFEQMLERTELRQLKQRIAVKATIKPLSRDESHDYIRHRVEKAVGDWTCLFTPSAAKLIVSHAGGIPRLINILCDNCLISTFGYKRDRVNWWTAREIIGDFSVKGRNSLGRLFNTASVVSILSIIVVIVCLVAYFVLNIYDPPPELRRTATHHAVVHGAGLQPMIGMSGNGAGQALPMVAWAVDGRRAERTASYRTTNVGN